MRQCVGTTCVCFEQRANIKFCFKIGKTFTETFELMKKVYGDDCLPRARVHEWFTRFRDGREDINDDEHTGRPKSVITKNSIEIVREFIKNEPKSSLKFMESELNISKTSIYRILTDHSGRGFGRGRMCSSVCVVHLWSPFFFLIFKIRVFLT